MGRARPALAGKTAAVSARLLALDDRALLGLRRHWPFLVLLAAAVALRVLVVLAYRPLLWFYGDSYAYLGVALDLRAYDLRPIGYSFFLQTLIPFEDLSVVPLVQHLLGLLVGAGVYALLRRLGVGRWLATAAAAPVLLDAYQLQLEHLLMADTLMMGLVGLAFLLLLGSARPSPALCAWTGAVLAMAALTRTVAVVLVVPVVAYLIARRAGLLRVALAVVLFALPLHVYSTWFFTEHQVRALSATDGFFLYGRVIPFVECDEPTAPTPLAVNVLCERLPPERRPGLEYYIFDQNSPAYRLPGTRPQQSEILRGFALDTVREQPLDYLEAVLDDVGDAVSPYRKPLPSEFTASNYRFFLEPRDLPEQVQRLAREYQGLPENRTPPLEDITPEEDGEVLPGGGQTQVEPELALWLAGYQDVVDVPGPFYAAAALVATAALALTRRGRPDDRRRAVCALFLLSGLAVVAVPILTQGFDYRYRLPALPMLSIAGALGMVLLLERYRPRLPAITRPGRRR